MEQPVARYFSVVWIKDQQYVYDEEYRQYFETSLITSNKHAWHEELAFVGGKVQEFRMEKYYAPKVSNLDFCREGDFHYKHLKGLSIKKMTSHIPNPFASKEGGADQGIEDQDSDHKKNTQTPEFGGFKISGKEFKNVMFINDN